MSASQVRESGSLIRALSRGYAVLLLAALAISPSFAIAYLHFFQDPQLRFEHHSFHEIAIGISILQGGFITYVTWRCYLHTGESFLRWLTLGFLGFTLIYALHGVFTRSVHDHVWQFILYGPASRLVMAGCLLTGLMTYGRPAPAVEQRSQRGFWLVWVGVFAAINVLVFILAATAWAPMARLVMEVSAMALMLACAGAIVARRIRSPLMTIYMVSLLFFTQSSLAFTMGAMWDHQWWLAHAVFAAGFMALSYGVVQAFLTTGSFTTVYSQAELMERIQAEKARAEGALQELQRAHENLKNLAATDPLTGTANRREFAARMSAELARSARSGTPLSVLVADLDHFKRINDQHGHHAGDSVLEAFVAAARRILRPSDLIGRLGGEEFALMLPDTTREDAGSMAERLRRVVENENVEVGGTRVRFTASIGVAQSGIDGDTYESVIDMADGRMYRAKQLGRNRVVAQ